eukprot:gnl/TRDRNA2_/TRDRNA2_159291_c0_seq1.p1 gnl/TRDRNA2_/TRDRNA2_159291_c0~~gnl/TRDRNA2_/TRDRNA2_159291_c0_seq1.p1  ORF type:complete len:353 (+),score=51.88 gnl/TRDRNA2_/TRDRNA2_159291_c0_seq1:62-1120(+)
MLWSAVAFCLLGLSHVHCELPLRQECKRTADFPPARQPFDHNKTFEPLLNGQAYAELRPKVLSVDPWIVWFEQFLSEEDLAKTEGFFDALDFIQSTTGDGGTEDKNPSRTSETSYCRERCEKAEFTKLAVKKAAAVTGVPVENWEPLQTTRYKPGTFFKPHYDASRDDQGLPMGSRIYTLFIYLTDVEEGGGTHFPLLGITAPARRGAAVFFVDTTDADPERLEERTLHEGTTVIRGEKLAVNLWAHQYNFMHFHELRCTKADEAVEANNEPRKVRVDFRNSMSAPVQLYWVNFENKEILVDEAAANSVAEQITYEGHKFRIRQGRELITEYSVGHGSFQQINIGATARSEL